MNPDGLCQGLGHFETIPLRFVVDKLEFLSKKTHTRTLEKRDEQTNDLFLHSYRDSVHHEGRW